MSLSWNRRMTAFCSSSVAVHSCSSSSSCSAVSSSVSIALVPSRSAAVRGQVAMPYEDSQERTSPPSLSHAIRAIVRGLLGLVGAEGADLHATRDAAERALTDGLADAERRVFLNDLLDLPQ